ncbi:MAG: hypothetical protein OXT09_01045 [Myxococcales bacterium]|nr:hypothetical protein [Myxococcales bacterium]
MKTTVFLLPLICGLAAVRPAWAQDSPDTEQPNLPGTVPAEDAAGAVPGTSGGAPPAEPAGAKPAQPPAEAPPAPAPVTVEPDDAEEPARRRRGSGLGIDPGRAQTGDLLVGEADAPVFVETDSKDDWKFEFHGFLRVPVRAGFGTAATTNTEDPDSLPGKIHVPPQIPDGTFTDWQYTGNLPGPWTELRFSYGNSRVTANVQLGAYNVTDAGYRNLQAQLGINQAFLTIDGSDLFGSRGGILWTVGAFSNRYGTAGKYDAGKYDTYLFGRTHAAGETLTAFYDVADDWRLTFEHGVGAKLEPPVLVSGLPEAPYLPYAGPVEVGSTLLHHAHVGATYDEAVTFALHYLTSWTDDARLADQVDGRITTVGAEVKLDAGIFGQGFLGFSRLTSEDPLRVDGAIEVLHSIAGWNLRDNYFGTGADAPDGNGTVDTLLWQYSYSFATLAYHPDDFWGQAPDLIATFFGMLNMVDGTDPEFAEAETKLKLGGELTYTPLSWLGISGRYDLVQPDMDQSEQSFHALSPKLILRTHFLAHEQIVLQYTRYIYGDEVRTAWPHGGLAPDEDALMLSAIMWW